MVHKKLILSLVFLSLIILPYYINGNIFASASDIPNPLLLSFNQLQISNPTSTHAIIIKNPGVNSNRTIVFPLNMAVSDQFATQSSANSFITSNSFVDGNNIVNCNTGIVGFQVVHAASKICFNLSGMSPNTGLIIRSNQTTSQQLYIPNLVSKDSVMLRVGQNQTDDISAVNNIPIPNHQCDWYYNTGNSTFRLICNMNGGVHVLSKG